MTSTFYYYIYNTGTLSVKVTAEDNNFGALSAAVMKGHYITVDDKHVLLLYNTGTLSVKVTAEDNRGVCCTKYDRGIICRSSYMR